jgi:hypothetical protein
MIVTAEIAAMHFLWMVDVVVPHVYIKRRIIC